MFQDAEVYEARAAECDRLAALTGDLVLREEILGLGRIYRDYAQHRRGRQSDEVTPWPQAANG